MEIGEIQNENFGSRSIENTNDLATILNIELGVNAQLKKGSTKVLEIVATSADKNALTPTLEKAKAFVLDRHTKLAEFYKAKIMTKELGSIAISDQINRPKKKLIVAVSLVTGFVLSIFLVFFIEFIRGFRADQN